MRKLVDTQKVYDLALGYMSDFARSCADLTSLREILDDAPAVPAIVLPCKVGGVRDTRIYNKPVKGVVTEIYFRDNMDMCIVVRRLCRGRWGERVFATEQEAQAAIDRRVNDGKM